MTDGSLHLNEEMKSTGNALIYKKDSMNTYFIIFSLKILKDIRLNKTKTITFGGTLEQKF